MILCLGTTPVYQRSMTFDRVTLDGVNRATHVRDYASGKSINAARVVHAMGHDVLAAGFVGGGPRGDLLCHDLDSSGIPHDLVRVAADTRQCITVIDQAAGSATELVEESLPVEGAAWQKLDWKLQMLLPKSPVWIFSGTLSPGASQDFYARWLPLAQELSATVIVDTRAEPLRLAMEHPNLIAKLNRDELAQTLNLDLSDDAQLLEAAKKHIPAQGKIVITLGASGAIGCDGQGCYRVHAPKVKAISAVGSGDAFAAGLAIALSRGEAFDIALRLAAACGSANALTPYAGHLRKQDVETCHAAARVEQLE